MNYLIKTIREALHMSQTEFGEKLGVAFSTINRWENEKAYPNKVAQLRIADLVTEYDLQIEEIIYDRIRSQAESIKLEDGRLLLYHGSKSGIEGNIMPNSRTSCDFGSGFYMGTIPEQPLTLICGYEEAKLYIVSIEMGTLKVLDIAPDIDWAMYVAYNRKRMEGARGTSFYQMYENLSKGYDVVRGSIANDRMFFVLDNFFMGNVTDKALTESLSALKLGEQYVAKSEKACSKIRIEKEVELSYLEKICLNKVAIQNREKGISLANDICKANRRNGLFFDEIIAKAGD